MVEGSHTGSAHTYARWLPGKPREVWKSRVPAVGLESEKVTNPAIHRTARKTSDLEPQRSEGLPGNCRDLCRNAHPLVQTVDWQVPSQPAMCKRTLVLRRTLPLSTNLTNRLMIPLSTAQRPCNRCVQNGKEDACVDVQHKKRGRPRLRDDHRGTGFDPRLGHSQDPNLRRPLSLYNPPSGISYGDDPLRRAQSYRVLKSQPPEPLAPRLLERGSVGGGNIFPAPLHISTRPPEPAAFLTMDLEIAKTSTTFLDAIGRLAVQGLRVTDLLVLEDRGRMAALQRQLQDEQARREPNYLPPMYVKQEEEKVFRALGFSREELAPYNLDVVDNFRFTDQAGQPRSVQVRLGLAKYGSIFFIIITLSMSFRPFPTPSPQNRDPREMGYSYPAPQIPYAQPTPVSATFDHGRGRSVSDVAYGLPRQPNTPGGVIPGLSPRLSSSYAASPSRPDYPSGHSAYIPRSELSAAAPRPQQPAGYQLPPIRSQQQQQQQQTQFQPHSQAQPQHAQYLPPQQAQPHSLPSDQGWPRDDRQRVDIGGLIDRPDPTHRHQG